MTSLRRRMLEDRYLRDSARALVKADVAHLKGDLERKPIGARIASRAKDGTTDVLEEAAALVSENKGAIAAVAAAAILWFARLPILSALGFRQSQISPDDGTGLDEGFAD